MICCKSGGHDHRDASAWSRELKRSLDKQLVTVGVSAALVTIDACVTEESQPLLSSITCTIARRGVAGVGAKRVPRGITQNRVKAGVGASPAGIVEEHFGKFELPMEEAFRRGNCCRSVQKFRTMTRRQRRVLIEQRSEHVTVDARR